MKTRLYRSLGLLDRTGGKKWSRSTRLTPYNDDNAISNEEKNKYTRASKTDDNSLAASCSCLAEILVRLFSVQHERDAKITAIERTSKALKGRDPLPTPY